MTKIPNVDPSVALPLLYGLREHLTNISDNLMVMEDRLRMLSQLTQQVRPCEGLEGSDQVRCFLEAEYGVTLKGDLWLTSPDADSLMNEIYLGIQQLSEVFLEICQNAGNCQYQTPQELFQAIFGSGYEDGITFDLTEGCANPPDCDAVMYTIGSQGIIVIGGGGRGVGGLLDEHGLVQRYLVTHELLHILSLKTGGVTDLSSSSGSLHSAYYQGIETIELGLVRLAGSLSSIRHPFYSQGEGYIWQNGLPSGLNNFGRARLQDQIGRWHELVRKPAETLTEVEAAELIDLSSQLEETGVELLNLYIWTNKTRVGADGVIRPIGFQSDISNEPLRAGLDALLLLIENQLPAWLEEAANFGSP